MTAGGGKIIVSNKADTFTSSTQPKHRPARLVGRHRSRLAGTTTSLCERQQLYPQRRRLSFRLHGPCSTSVVRIVTGACRKKATPVHHPDHPALAKNAPAWSPDGKSIATSRMPAAVRTAYPQPDGKGEPRAIKLHRHRILQRHPLVTRQQEGFTYIDNGRNFYTLDLATVF